MDYFDNTPLIEQIVESSIVPKTKVKSSTGWWIAGLILTGCIAGFFYYKYKQATRETAKHN